MLSSPQFIGFMGLPGGMEWVLILLLGLLLFGRRLPEVGRSMGKSIVEFKKGVAGIEDEIDQASKKPSETKAETQSLPSETPAQPAPKPAAPEPIADPVDERRVSKADEVE